MAFLSFSYFVGYNGQKAVHCARPGLFSAVGLSNEMPLYFQ